ncbi:hypothetical protein [Vibrio sp. Hal054]|uniref:hypothetical protein n=1 Tax=Vibrio sp. Hal054 TaxID=3035158 RepID=UPI00301C5CD6
MSIITFEQRKAKILTLEDLEHQISCARKYVKRLRCKAKKQDTLAAKLLINDDVKAAEKVFRDLRLASFDIEDEIKAKTFTASSNVNEQG